MKTRLLKKIATKKISPRCAMLMSANLLEWLTARDGYQKRDALFIQEAVWRYLPFGFAMFGFGEIFTGRYSWIDSIIILFLMVVVSYYCMIKEEILETKEKNAYEFYRKSPYYEDNFYILHDELIKRKIDIEYSSWTKRFLLYIKELL